MKRDLDRLMAERNIDAIVVEGPDGLGSANPDFNYFVQGADLTGTVIKKRGEPAMLLHSPWEQIQAESTGLALIPTNRWNLREIMNETGDRFQAYVELRRRIFTSTPASISRCSPGWRRSCPAWRSSPSSIRTSFRRRG